MRVGYGDGEGKTRPHPAPLPCLGDTFSSHTKKLQILIINNIIMKYVYYP